MAENRTLILTDLAPSGDESKATDSTTTSMPTATTPTEIVQHYQPILPSMWEAKVAQTKNRLLPFVTPVTLDGKITFFDQIDSFEMEQKLSRFERINITENSYDRRAITSKKFVAVKGFDEDDDRKLGKQSLPIGATMAEFAAAAERKSEAELLNAIVGTAKTGEDGSVLVDLPTSQKLESTFLYSNPSNTTKLGMTFDKFARARRIFMENEAYGMGVMNGADQLCAALAAAQIENLAQDVKANNKDYIYAIEKLQNFETDMFLGVRIIRTQQVSTHLESSDLIRDCPFWLKSRVKFGFAENFSTKMWIANELSEAIVIRAKMECGGTRMEEKGVVIVECLEV